MVGGLDAVGAVFAPAGVAYADLLPGSQARLGRTRPGRCRESTDRTAAAAARYAWLGWPSGPVKAASR